MPVENIINSLITPKNIRSGVNLLQNNKGIIDTLTGIPIGPASGRAYVRNLSGSTTPIDESFFNNSQLGEIKNRTASAMADKSMKYNVDNQSIPVRKPYDNFNTRNNVVDYTLSTPISMSGIFSNPITDIDATMGKFTYNQNQDGTVSAIDKHDFDSFGGGDEATYGGKMDMSGQPYSTEKGLPFLEPQLYEGITYQGEEIVPDTYETQTDTSYENRDDVLKRATDNFKAGLISSSKLARIVGGQEGLTGDDVNQPYYKDINFMRDDWTRSGIPMNINLGRISQLDKLRSNRSFSNYIYNNQNIPSQIRKNARPFADINTTPIHQMPQGSPSQINTGGGRDSSQGNTQTGFGRSGMGRDPNDRMAMGGLIDLYRNGGFI